MHLPTGPRPTAAPALPAGGAWLRPPIAVCPDPIQFVNDVQPLLEQRDLGGLIRLLGMRYSTRQICSLLNCEFSDARKVAALALALVGEAEAITPLVEHLRDPDRMVNEMAEHALWSIWFRGGSSEANTELCRGSEALNQRDLDRASEHFSKAIALCPAFAEAFNQRAIVHYLQERFDQSLADCRRASELMPCHFGAWAGMGHCHAHRGDLDAALSCYRRAVAINPHLDCVAEMIRELENCENQECEGHECQDWAKDRQPRRPHSDCGHDGMNLA